MLRSKDVVIHYEAVRPCAILQFCYEALNTLMLTRLLQENFLTLLSCIILLIMRRVMFLQINDHIL
jgi:hypothetical protein